MVSFLSVAYPGASTTSSLLSFLSLAVSPEVPYWGQYNSFHIPKI